MISDFMKRLNDERIAASQFRVGEYVAMVNHHWDRRVVAKRKIAKIYANGNFVLASNEPDRPIGVQQWRPDADGKTARRTGTYKYRDSEHLEPWSPEIEAEVAERRKARLFEQRVKRLIGHFEDMKYSAETAGTVERIEELLGLAPLQTDAAKPTTETD